ncbi:MAG TPA: hypothetical protein VN370_04110 [Desulfitobacteriaceae bacterium]|jgi:hypothetical protein|nr:hypothetical protein [Desulfitobacteriaceae bacterium]
MNFPKDEQLRLWFRNLSLFTAFVVCLLSWLNGNDFVRIIFKTGITFLVIYGLTVGCLVFFRKTANLEFNEEIDQENHQGTLLDVSLGDEVTDQNGDSEITDQDSKFNGLNTGLHENKRETDVGRPAGQVDPAFINGTISHQQQADIIRRMGWKEEE